MAVGSIPLTQRSQRSRVSQSWGDGWPARRAGWIERKPRKRTPFASRGARFLDFLSIQPAAEAAGHPSPSALSAPLRALREIRRRFRAESVVHFAL